MSSSKSIKKTTDIRSFDNPLYREDKKDESPQIGANKLRVIVPVQERPKYSSTPRPSKTSGERKDPRFALDLTRKESEEESREKRVFSPRPNSTDRRRSQFLANPIGTSRAIPKRSEVATLPVIGEFGGTEIPPEEDKHIVALRDYDEDLSLLPQSHISTEASQMEEQEIKTPLEISLGSAEIKSKIPDETDDFLERSKEDLGDISDEIIKRPKGKLNLEYVEVCFATTVTLPEPGSHEPNAQPSRLRHAMQPTVGKSILPNSPVGRGYIVPVTPEKMASEVKRLINEYSRLGGKSRELRAMNILICAAGGRTAMRDPIAYPETDQIAATLSNLPDNRRAKYVHYLFEELDKYIPLDIRTTIRNAKGKLWSNTEASYNQDDMKLQLDIIKSILGGKIIELGN